MAKNISTMKNSGGMAQSRGAGEHASQRMAGNPVVTAVGYDLTNKECLGLLAGLHQ